MGSFFFYGAALLALLQPALSTPVPFVATSNANDSAVTDASPQGMNHHETPDMMVVTVLLIAGGVIVLTVTAVKLYQRRGLTDGS
jgi:hypothetical protein